MIATHYENQIVANQSTKQIKINNIDSNRQQIREQHQSQLVILILTIWRDIASNQYNHITNFSFRNKGYKIFELLGSWKGVW